jgi:hypothetical protein
MDQVGPLDSATAGFSALEDLGTGFAKKYGVRLCGSIAEALCLGGADVAVDGILAIGEHGDYPVNDKGQKLYPRRHFWEQITGVLSTSPRRSQIPIFTDKHLAVTWEDAAWIYRTGKELGLVHMAGSSVPVYHRDPWLEHPLGECGERFCDRIIYTIPLPVRCAVYNYVRILHEGVHVTGNACGRQQHRHRRHPLLRRPRGIRRKCGTAMRC